jgi:LPXTG-motif cell wall-anchored protein
MKKVSIVIFLVGLVLTIFTTVTYFTKEKVVDIGKIEISRDKPHSFNWSPFLGIAIMGVGGILYWQKRNE